MKNLAPLTLVSVLMTGCVVGPNYHRPKVDAPTVYRGLTPEETARNEAKSFADEKWWEVLQDEQLRQLIRTALAQNYDVRIAAARILQAQAQLGITRSEQFPTINGQASTVDERSALTKFLPAFETSINQVGLSLFWDLDFWGKYRRATEAARANLRKGPLRRPP